MSLRRGPFGVKRWASSFNTIYTASAAYSDVAAAVAAASPGDTVSVPAGSATWESVLHPSVPITILGAGSGQTIITCGSQGGWPDALGIIKWSLQDTGLSRISGFRFNAGTQAADGNNAGMIQIEGSSSQFRFDHNLVDQAIVSGSVTNFALRTAGYVRGVIDNNTFLIPTGGICLQIRHDSWGGIGSYGDNSWATAAPLGTADALFIEHNTASITDGTGLTAFLDGDTGERRVVRYNTLTDVALFAHGTATTGRPRGGRSFEIYENDLTYTQHQPSVISMGSGAGVIYNNRLVTSGGGIIDYGIDLDYWRPGRTRTYWIWGWSGETAIDSITRSGSTATVTVNAGHGIYDSAYGNPQVRISGASQAEYNGTFTATRVSAYIFTITVSGTPATPATGTLILTCPWDGNTDQYGYPCIDQPGRGTGDLITGDYPINGAWPNQALDPVYVWGNTKNGSALSPRAVASNVIVLNRDYYESEKSGYAAYAYPHPLTL
jgi:hypothetical protein